MSDTNQKGSRFRRSGLILAAVIFGGAVVAAAVLNQKDWFTAAEAPYLPSEDLSQSLPLGTSIEVRYIANEGVLISTRDKRVLIDGLHRKYDDAYSYLPDAEREKIETAKPPFEKIDLILVSHYHGDHFQPESVGRYLSNSPKTLLATSQQVVAEVAAKYTGYETVKSRITPMTFTLKDRQPMQFNGIDVEFLGVGHGSGRFASIQNLGHVITLGGKKLLHIGDAEISDEIFDAFDLNEQNIDVAFLPYWFMTSASGRALIEKHIRPKHMIAVHVGPAEADDIERQVKQHFPQADVFKTMLEKRVS